MNYGSFYGGKRGTSFVIVKNYPDIASMVRDFSQGGNFLDVKYDEYVIINTINKNNGDNGKIFRRGYDYNSERKISGYRVYKNGQEIIDGNAQDYQGATYTFKEDIPAGGAVYVGTIVGPAGRSPHLKILSYDDIQTIQEGFQNQKSQGSLSLVKEDLLPGKYKENNEVKYNDDILWYCASVRNQNQDDSTAYIGFKIPYPVTEFITESVSAYDNYGQIKDTSKAERVDDLSHPFYEKWKLSIPKGIKGNSLRNIYVTTFEDLPNEKVFISQNNYYLYNNVLEVFEYGDEDQSSSTSLDTSSIKIEIGKQTYRILPKTQIIIGEEFSYDAEKNPIQPIKIHFLGILNQIVQDGFTIEDNGDIRINFTDGTSLEKTGFIKSIDDIVFYRDSEDNNKLKLQILFNTEDELGNKENVEYENVKFIDDISFDDNGTVTVNFTNGETYTKTNVFKNITNIAFDSNNLVFSFNDGTSERKPISWISDMQIDSSTGNINVKRNGGSDWQTDPIGKMKWIESMTYTQDQSDNYSNKTTVMYNDGTSDVFENAFKSIVDVQVNSETNKLVIVYNTIDPNTNENQTSEIDLAGGLITNVSYDYAEGEVTVEYSGGKADQTFSLDVPAKVTFANSNPQLDDYKLKITSLNDDVTFLESGPIDSIYDVQITPNDHHLVVLFASADTRANIINEEKNYGSEITARDGVSYSGWLDLGSITNKSGIFIGLNLGNADFNNTDVSTLSISQIVAKLNTDYPTGLQDIDENQGLAGKIITVGQPQSDKRFFGFNYSYDNEGNYKGWYYLGSIDNVDNVISCAMGTYDQFVQEGSPAESVAEDGLYFIIQNI